MSTETDFELVEESERKSSTSESFENVDENKEEISSADEAEETLEAPKKAENQAENEPEPEEELKLPFVDQSIKDDAEKPAEKDGEQLVQDALTQPIRADQEQFYSPEDNRRAITLLILFSAMMFTLPLLVMFTLYYWVFIDYFHLPADRAMLYAGICAACVVVAICAAFAWIAWKEEKEAEEKLKKLK
ncbi:unnamed protein product [Caenorhabditis angaria]|uniref:Vacuolar ATPase assembly integral membrane protein VMA21 homolog n=1 Tax=Caenorhabditis angaria TaxID=860376 RepID=A0A9P1IFK5_9PELO|nr:unnamed protein product [Caenorhabditis angaria]